MKSEWINIKDKLPPFKEFVEVIYPDKNSICDLNRDFAAYLKDDDGCFWMSAGMDERNWSKDGYKIKYWRPMNTDTKGRKPFITITKRGYYKVILKKVKE